jgi:hypothetical protein
MINYIYVYIIIYAHTFTIICIYIIYIYVYINCYCIFSWSFVMFYFFWCVRYCDMSLVAEQCRPWKGSSGATWLIKGVQFQVKYHLHLQLLVVRICVYVLKLHISPPHLVILYIQYIQCLSLSLCIYISNSSAIWIHTYIHRYIHT